MYIIKDDKGVVVVADNREELVRNTLLTFPKTYTMEESSEDWQLINGEYRIGGKTIEEQNEAIRKQREAEYQSLTDPLTLRKMRKDALGEWTPDDEKQYLDELRRISDEINAKYPYVEEIGNV